jgi:RNA polymerase sigma factor (sigma-70 family)
LEEIEIDIADLSPNGEEQLLMTDLIKSLNHSIAKLSDQCQLVFRLVKEDGYKYKEVAEMLDISIKTVEYHMGNALKKIAEDLNPSLRHLTTASVKKIV